MSDCGFVRAITKMNPGNAIHQLSQRRRGFRFSVTDLIAIMVCAVVTWLLWPVLDKIALLFPITLGHFFLFCNVFRIRRSFELIWAAAFIVNVGYSSFVPPFHWPTILAWQTPLTATLIVMECCSERYHGVFCRKETASE